MKRFLLPALLVLALTTACVDASYDFDRLNRDVALGGEDFVLPLLNTRQLTVEDLVGERLEQYLTLNDDRTYSLSYDSDPYSFSLNELRDYDTSAPFRRYINYPINYSFHLFGKPASLPFDDQGEAGLEGIVPALVRLPNLSKTATLSVPRLPEELVDVQSITLSDDSHFDVTISLTGGLFSEGTLKPDFYVDLSEFFESKDAEDGLIHFDTPLDESNGYTATRSFNLHKVVFSPDDFDPQTHTVTLHASVRVNGQCQFSGMKTDRSHYEQADATANLLVQVILRTVDCEAFVGAYDYTVSDISTSVNVKDMLSSFSGLFDGQDFSIQLSKPEIRLDVETNIPIPTRATLNLSARKGNTRYAQLNDVQVDFPYAEPGQTIRHSIRLAEEAAHEDGIDDVIVDFSAITSRIPDLIQVSATASTLKDRIAEVRFGGTYYIDMQPRLRVPFAFGADTQIELRDTLSLPADLGSILKDNTVVLAGEMANTLPLEVDLSVVMIDDAGVRLTEEVTQHIAAGATTSLSVPLKNRAGDGIERLSKAVLTFRISGVADPRPLRSDDYLQASLRAQLPGGYHFSF